ncbi:hypothetical protein L1887_09736 [Cichorium endivia]|nr:hypothetical protein L1887_09736 [Cichorium endivia]
MLGRLSTRISLGGADSTVCLLLPLLACLDIAFLLLIGYLISSVLHYNKHLIGTIYKDKACPLGNLVLRIIQQIVDLILNSLKLHNMSRGYKHEEAAPRNGCIQCLTALITAVNLFFNSFNTTTDVSSKTCSVGNDLDHYAHYADAFIHSSSSHNSFNSFLEPPSYADAVGIVFETANNDVVCIVVSLPPDNVDSGKTISGQDISKTIEFTVHL